MTDRPTIIATVVSPDGQIRHIPENALKGGPIKTVTFHRPLTRTDVRAFLPCLVKGTKWRMGSGGFWRNPEELREATGGR